VQKVWVSLQLTFSALNTVVVVVMVAVVVVVVAVVVVVVVVVAVVVVVVVGVVVVTSMQVFSPASHSQPDLVFVLQWCGSTYGCNGKRRDTPRGMLMYRMYAGSMLQHACDPMPPANVCPKKTSTIRYSLVFAVPVQDVPSVLKGREWMVTAKVKGECLQFQSRIKDAVHALNVIVGRHRCKLGRGRNAWYM
jgi:hypothetical protein